MRAYNAGMRTALVLIAVTACGSPHRDGNGGDGGSGSVDAQPVNLCKVTDDSNGVPNCTDVAPANSFDPDIQWMWIGPNGETNSIVTPLVANLTDDNGDGAIDLCDVPDVVVVASTGVGQPEEPGHIYLLNGQTGAQELMIAQTIDGTVTPALGDLDGDGVAEIVTVDQQGKLWAFHHDGTPLFGPAGQWAGEWYSGAIALADLDHDGHVEIIGGNTVFDDHGTVKWSAPAQQASWNASTAADLDGDGYMEVVLGAAAYHYDGTVYFNDTPGVQPGYPQIANLDDDPQPEILVTNSNGLTLLNHDGTIKYQDLRPTGSPAGGTTWLRPATIHDFDGDGKFEYAMSSANYYTEYHADGTIKWSAPVSDQSGIAAGTAFDFLGNGHAEAMYADEQYLYVFDSTGTPIFKMPRSSGTLSEYPVVADIDNDGSAEIVVVSNTYMTSSPTVQVIRDKQDRWIQARRIWNEHAYHVTNVREDGTIPQFEQPSWQRLNTFRTNAQISGGAACQPPIL